MTYILVVPDQLRSLSTQLEQAAGELRTIRGQLNRALNNLDWEVRYQAGVERQWNGAYAQVNSLVNQSETLAHYLAAKAQAFEEADAAGASRVGQIGASFINWWQGMGNELGLWGLSGEEVRGIWRLGGIASPQSTKASFGALLRQASPAKVTFGALLRQQWEVQPQNQRYLKLRNGAETDYGCTPTAASMILDFWHAQDPSRRTLSAQELLDINIEQGEFKKGMSVSNIRQELAGLGYTVSDQTDSDLGALREAVRRGPVIAVVKLHMRPDGENHSVVVAGYSPDGVLICDPWDGSKHTCTWEQFSRSWGADFGPGEPKNSFVEIHPS